MGFADRFKSRDDTLTASDLDVVEGVTVDPATDLRNFRKQHRWDPFLDIQELDNVDEALASGDTEKKAAIDVSLIQEDSPYGEVRSSVPPTDSDMPINTIRAWTLGALLCTIVAACNVLLYLRQFPVAITSTVVQLIAYPIGCFWAKVVPNATFKVFGQTLELNPGPFNIKEHTIVTIMTAAGTTFSYAIDILRAQELFYHQYFQWGFQILLIISTQAMGLGLAGVSRRFLVWPSSMIWPSTLVTATVMHSLHDHKASDPAATNGWKIGRYSFFLVIAISSFVWEWVPQVFAQFLQFFNFACWIAPQNVIVNQLFGGISGLGLLPISFDWSIPSAFLGSPLQTPAFATFNVAGGLLLALLGAVGLAYGGPDFYRYLPISANQNWDRFAKPYNTSRILTPDFTVNETAYAEYSPIILGATFSLSYGMGFAALISTITHVALFYGPDVWNRAKSSRYEEPDIHMKLMRKYKEAPEWWFAAIFVLSFAFGMIASQVWPTHLPWWAFILCILIAVFFFIPVGMVLAITNQPTGLNVITEMIVGYMLPGRPVAMMLFKSWGYMLSYNGLNYISDMKVGHYMKIPPRTMFAAQSFAVIWLFFVQIFTYNFLRGNIEGICTPGQKQGLTCPSARTFYNASVIRGVIGPKKVFGAGGMYSWLNWFWFIGFALPVVQFFLARRYPRSFLRYVVTPWAIISVVFNFWLRRRAVGWWNQYNYVLSGALDIGTALCIVVVGLGLGLGNANFPDWWGNTVPFENLDANNKAVTKLFVKGQTPIGPTSW